jgi:DNA-binding PadR family transcriptional regulator
MRGLRHSEDRCGGGLWAGRRFGRFGGRGPGWEPGPEGGGGDWFRVGRMLAQGDLKLLALALIAEQPRHGYELIKLIEEKTSGAYSPSPGVIYPTLTFLEEAGYVTAESEGAKKRYTITEPGRAYLEENRDVADMILDRLAAIGKKLARRRRAWEKHENEAKGVPQLVDAALDNLRAATLKRLETEGAEGDAETRIVEILARAAQDIRGA